MIEIRQALHNDISILYTLYKDIGHKDPGYFESCFDKDITIFIASFSSQDCGFVLLNWVPKYKPYKQLNIPEIQDLNVIPTFRNRGAGTALIGHCEEIVRQKNIQDIGISVGLTKAYGPAQRLYAKLGYIPDGQGITYDREGVNHAEIKPIDDNLCLMLMKRVI